MLNLSEQLFTASVSSANPSASTILPSFCKGDIETADDNTSINPMNTNRKQPEKFKAHQSKQYASIPTLEMTVKLILHCSCNSSSRLSLSLTLLPALVL